MTVMIGRPRPHCQVCDRPIAEGVSTCGRLRCVGLLAICQDTAREFAKEFPDTITERCGTPDCITPATVATICNACPHDRAGTSHRHWWCQQHNPRRSSDG